MAHLDHRSLKIRLDFDLTIEMVEVAADIYFTA